MSKTKRLDHPAVIDVFVHSMELAALAHGTAPEARDCEACRLINEQLGEWLAAHTEKREAVTT